MGEVEQNQITQLKQVCRHDKVSLIKPATQTQILLVEDFEDLLAALPVVALQGFLTSKVTAPSFLGTKTYSQAFARTNARFKDVPVDLQPSPLGRAVVVLQATIKEIKSQPGKAGTQADLEKFKILEKAYSTAEQKKLWLFDNLSPENRAIFRLQLKASGKQAMLNNIGKLQWAIRTTLAHLMAQTNFPAQLKADLKLTADWFVPLAQKTFDVKRTRNQHGVARSQISSFYQTACHVKIKKAKPAAVKIKKPVKKLAPRPSWFTRATNTLAKIGNYTVKLRALGGGVVNDAPLDSGLTQFWNMYFGGAVKLGFSLPKNFGLALEYTGGFAYDPTDSDKYDYKFVVNDDFPKIALEGSISRVDFKVALGYRHYRHDLPTFIQPTQDSGVFELGARVKLSEQLALDFAVGLQLGSVDYKGKLETEDYHFQANIRGLAGVDWQPGWASIVPSFIGGVIAEEETKMGIIGGQLQVTKSVSILDFRLSTYFLNYGLEQNFFAGSLDVGFRLTKFMRLIASLGPVTWAQGPHRLTKEETTVITTNGGLSFQFGWPFLPTGLTNQTILPEQLRH